MNVNNDFKFIKEEWSKALEDYNNLYKTYNNTYQIIKQNKDYKFFILSGYRPNFKLLDCAFVRLKKSKYSLKGITTTTEAYASHINNVVNKGIFLDDIVNDQFIDWSFDGEVYTGVHKHHFLTQIEKADAYAAYYGKVIIIENPVTAVKVKEMYPSALMLYFHETYSSQDERLKIDKFYDYSIVGYSKVAENGVTAIVEQYLNVK